MADVLDLSSVQLPWRRNRRGDEEEVSLPASLTDVRPSLASPPYLHVQSSQHAHARAREKLLAMQHAEGGFGGGPGQAPHLLATYAAVSALAIVGEPGPGGGWDDIDRWLPRCSSRMPLGNL